MRKLLSLAALVTLVGAARTVHAQTDIIRGKVTDAQGAPVSNVRVTATSIPGNVTRDTRTDSKGAFQIVFPNGTGDYIMGYASIGYSFRQFEIKRTADQDILIADARLAPVILDTVQITVESQAQRVNRNQPTPDVSGTERAVPTGILPPELQGDIAAMAASLPGVLLIPGIDGSADGFSVFGLGADQNNVTLNGMQTGASGLPRDASISSSMTTSPYDVSRGGFSGANFNIRSGSGSNFKQRGMSLVSSTPQVQWTDRAAQDLGTKYTNLSLSGMASGPIRLNKAFYNFSYQADRNSRSNQSLLSTSALGLRTAGIASDSVTRFLDILGRNGVSGLGGPLHSQRLRDGGSVFGSIDVSPPSSATGQSFNITFNGQMNRNSPVGGSAMQLPSSSGDQINWNGGLQGRHSAYVKTILTESSAGFNVSRNYGDPYLDFPAARVRVNSSLDNGQSGVQFLTFGGNQGLSSRSRSTGATFQNTLSWFDDGNKHRIKLATELAFSGNTQDQSSNLLGTYSFNSLEDLDAGRPASFSRLLTARTRSTGQFTGAMSLGDSYRRTPDLQIQYGVRVDGTRYTATPEYNQAIETTFGRRNDRVPTPIVISPRIGFSYTLGESQEFAQFFGAVRAPRAILRGGVAVLTNNASSGLISGALDNTGLPTGTKQINCVGSAVPIPDWNAYAADLSTIPDRCADGSEGTVFSNAAPSVTLFSKDFLPQQTIRSNVSWTGAILDARFNATFDATHSYNRHQQRTIDLNFQPTERFALANEASRPVFVQPTSIVPATGAIASRDARVSQSFNRVNEVRSDLNGQTAQLSIRISPIYRTQTSFSWSGSYTYSHIREQVSGFSSTAGNPLGIEWFRSGQGPHQIQYNLRYVFFNAIQVNWNGSFRSGSAYTPTVVGDINGDGYSNDRAFIFDPNGSADPALASGMQQLLAQTSGSARECLESQFGRIASRNSCRAPWTSSASLRIDLDRSKFRMPTRASVGFSLQNPFGAADLALNGSGKLRGWGMNNGPEQGLLYVRGFDASTNQYRYEVNQRFGATRPQNVILRNPVVLTATMRYDLGATREEQSLRQRLDAGRSLPGSRFPESLYRSMGTSAVQNPMSYILQYQDSLSMTALQADSIASMNRRYTYRVDSIWAPVARYFTTLPVDYHSDEAWDRYLQARKAHIDLLIKSAPLVRELLTSAQRRKIPASVQSALDPRFLNSIRNGQGFYVTGGQFGGGAGGSSMGMPPMAMMGVERVIFH